MRRDTPEFEVFQDRFGMEAEAEGWGLYLTDGGELLELLMSDRNDRFNDDADARAHVVKRADADPSSDASAAFALISEDYRNRIRHAVLQISG